MLSFPVRVLLCWPIDPDQIDRLNELVRDPAQHFTPTEKHRPGECDSCRTPVWIQQEHYTAAALTGHRKLCFTCAHAISKALGGIQV